MNPNRASIRNQPDPERPAAGVCPTCDHAMLVHENGRCTYSVKVPGGRVPCDCGWPEQGKAAA